MSASVDFSHVTFISAGAGSGKTYRLTEELETALLNGVDPAHVIGTTFTVKAAGELNEKVRERLIESGQLKLAEQMAQALVGTVHSVCERLLKRFSFELGLSPMLNVMSIEDGKKFFSQALDAVLTLDKVRQMNAVSTRLSVRDWEAKVKTLADRVQENNVPLTDLAAMGKESANSLLAFFPPAQNRDANRLKRVVLYALDTIDTVADTTNITRDYLGTLRQSAYWLGREDCPWSEWIGLSAAAPGEKSDSIAAKVRESAEDYESNAQFQGDIRIYLESTFEIASAAIAQFQNLKKQRGLIDFLDMEQLTLEALDEPAVQDRLNDELELLLVDEFQDTNPMQLALFIKLAAIANKVIFVGDVKQAIYAFRGCDPNLVFETLDGLTAASAKKDILEINYRSRPDLVHYINEVFAEAFNGEIDRAQVVLDPERDERTGNPAVIGWELEGGRYDQRVSALCGGLADLVASDHQVIDPHTDQLRPVRWGDIAILARTNSHVEEIAHALKDQRIPMKMTLEGLLATPEVYFARACLRRLNDMTDTLATAEIISMADCAQPEAWLTERIKWVQSDAANYSWAEGTHPVIKRLAELRDDSALRSPVEIVARVVNDVHTRRIVTSWGTDSIKAAQRQRNLDAFLNLAVEYENHSGSHYEAASLTGFLFWLEHPSSPELDLQPVVTTGDAVHVLTYHRAKGLEWPVVITTDFEDRERSNLWGVHVDLTAEFDINDPLANRTIRYWLDPFDRRTKNIKLLDKINQTQDAQDVHEKERFEQRRLAYVGLTRARDLNVIALPKKVPQAAWFHTFSTGAAFPRQDEHMLPNGSVIAARFESLSGTGGIESRPFTPIWYPAQPRTAHIRDAVNPSAAQSIKGATIGEVIELGERIRIRDADMTAIGSGLHAVIAAELVNPEQPDAVARAHELLQSWGVDASVDPGDAVEAGRRCLGAINKRFGAVKVYVEYPVTDLLEDERGIKGWIDALIETEEGWVILDHKSSPRPRSEWGKEAVAYSGQLATYRTAVERSGRKVIGTWIHFPVSGGLVEVVGAERNTLIPQDQKAAQHN